MINMQALEQSDLNLVQKQAIAYDQGPLLILAGAGSGKTRVITERIIRLIHEGHAAPWNIAALTFTNKAAEEMRTRVQQRLGERGRRVCIRTFHSLALAILRRDGLHVGVDPRFSIADRTIQKNLVQKILKRLRIPADELAPNYIIYHIDRARDQLLDPDQYLNKIIQYETRANLIHQLYNEYVQELKNNQSVDYAGLLYYCSQLLCTNQDVCAGYQQLWRYFMVDEYQDTNHAQYQMVKALACGHQNIMVVGDEDQSIYSWRGADIHNILSFNKDYPNAVVLNLEENYRSSKNILNLANRIITNNENRHKEKKACYTNNPEGESIKIYEFMSDLEEADNVVKDIQTMLSSGVAPREIAIFYRINAQSRVFEERLRRARIPYILIGDIRFFDRKEIKDILAMLQVICNPKDSLSLTRIINIPPRGIGQVTINRLQDYAEKQKISLYDALAQADKITSLRAAPATQKLHQLFEKWRNSDATKISDLVEQILKDTQYLKQLSKENPLEYERRASNVYEFIQTLRDLEKQDQNVIEISIPIEIEENINAGIIKATDNEHNAAQLLIKIDEFLKCISLNSGEKSEDASGATVSVDDCVRLMTLHNAKGLEFKKVWIVGVEEDNLPHRLSKEDPDQLEEERRLFYVGVTRAREELTISSVKNRFVFGRHQERKCSRFIFEAMDDNMETRSLHSSV